jgi:soluble lytic murein transglycosylase-like protein
MGKIVTPVFILLVLSQFAFGAENQPLSALVQAIITVESGGKPFAVHMGGTTYQPDTLEEASRLVMEAIKDGRNFDVGLMQVNSWWMRRFGISPESLLVPETNMAWGKAILRGEIARHGLTWKAVGRYHSPDPERGRRYAWKVYWNYKSGPTAHEAKEINQVLRRSLWNCPLKQSRDRGSDQVNHRDEICIIPIPSRSGSSGLK